MDTKLNIRPAETRDMRAIADIAQQTQLFPSEMLSDMIAGYLNQTSRDIWFVGELEDGIVTFGFCEPERMTVGTWNLLAIGVSPQHQGKGCGALMMRYLESQLVESGERVLLVETMATPEFELTRAFYCKNGFTEEARIREFYEAGADKIIFWKHL